MSPARAAHPAEPVIQAADPRLPWARTGHTPWLTARRAATLLNVKPDRLRYWADRRLLTALRRPMLNSSRAGKPRRVYRFRKDEIQALQAVAAEHGAVTTELLRNIAQSAGFSIVTDLLSRDV